MTTIEKQTFLKIFETNFEENCDPATDDVVGPPKYPVVEVFARSFEYVR
jgi:hypothetical protein